jgi:sugar lactone lactonase YvrE
MQRFINGKFLRSLFAAALLGVYADYSSAQAEPNRGTLNLVVRSAPGTPDVGAGVVVARRTTGAVVVRLREGANALNAGTYTLIAAPIRRPGAIVDAQVTGVVTPAQVVIAAAAARNATASYRLQPGRLWIPGSETATLHGYSPVALTRGTTAPGEVTITGAGMRPFAIAFNRGGIMWVADQDGNAILGYTPAQLRVGGSGPPAATIASTAEGSLNRPASLAFDAAGNLWVGNFGNDTVVRYSVAQLRQALVTQGAASPAPAVTLSSTALDQPYGLAFDRARNLWVASNATDAVLKFAAGQLATGGALTPAATTTGTLQAPRGPAFDAAGNLWVASNGTSQVVRYTVNAMGQPLQPLATGIVRGDDTTPASPSGLAFDNAGNLWVTDSGSDELLKYNVADLTGGATAATPATVITGFGDIGGVFPAFNPPPRQLPLILPPPPPPRQPPSR